MQASRRLALVFLALTLSASYAQHRHTPAAGASPAAPSASTPQRPVTPLIRGRSALTQERETRELSKEDRDRVQWYRLRYPKVMVLPIDAEAASAASVTIELPGHGTHVLHLERSSEFGFRYFASEGTTDSTRSTLQIDPVVDGWVGVIFELNGTKYTTIRLRGNLHLSPRAAARA